MYMYIIYIHTCIARKSPSSLCIISLIFFFDINFKEKNNNADDYTFNSTLCIDFYIFIAFMQIASMDTKPIGGFFFYLKR